jgi:hypothetical protein
VRLFKHGIKIFENVLKERLKKLTKIDGRHRQFGFSSGKSRTDAVFILRQIQEKFEQKKRKLYHVFVDLEKSFDLVPRGIIEWALRMQGVPETLIALTMALYVETISQVRTVAGSLEDGDVTVGVHHGSMLSQLLFITLLEEATKEYRGKCHGSCYMRMI